MMFFHKRVDLPGSDRTLPPSCEQIGEADGNLLVDVTVVLRRKGNRPLVSSGILPRVSREEFAQKLGADPADAQAVEQFAHHNHLTVVATSLEKRRVVLRGNVKHLSKAFGVKLMICRNSQTGDTFRGRTGPLTIPEELKDIVVAVLGLDDRQAASAHFRIRSAAAAGTAGTFTAQDLKSLYNFPQGVDGTGQTIGIIELGGGYTTADLQTYFQGVGLAVPSVTAVSVDGGANTPGSDADGEVELDIEVSGTIAPGANIAVYFAPNTDQGFIDAITDAVHDATRKPSVISISWGGPEDSWTAQSRTAMDAALQDAATLGVSVTIAAGDNGSTDGAGDGKLHVDFPCSSSFALACGGTTLKASNGKITSETVWNETSANEGAGGGGVSNEFALPSYQAKAGVPANPETKFVGRGVPDVSGNADPVTGYQVVVDGASIIVGGTSAVAPLWAGLIALLNQSLGAPVGFLNPTIYALGEGPFRDITTGNNDDSGLGFYSAKAGWDPCTGLGSPNGTALLDALTPTTTSSSSSAIAGKYK
jgi:kumamolisin